VTELIERFVRGGLASAAHPRIVFKPAWPGGGRRSPAVPPGTAGRLAAIGHDARTPAGLGAHNLPDDVLLRLAADEDRVIGTNSKAWRTVSVRDGALCLARRAAYHPRRNP